MTTIAVTSDMCIPKIYFYFNDNFDSFIFPVDCLMFATGAHKSIVCQGMKSIWFHLHGHVGLTSRVFTVLIVEDGSVGK